MKALLNKIDGINDKQLNKVFAFTLAAIIILDCDEYLYPFFQNIHLPLPSTILTFIWLPLFCLLVFYRKEKNKKKVITGALLLGIVYGVYFIFHHLNSRGMMDTLILPDNFYYSLYQEISYYLRMLIPLVYIYVIYKLNLDTNTFENIVIMISIMISVPILVTNIFTCSPSTYEGWTKANLFTWFFGIYDTYTPRQIATCFFFSEGNTTGMMMFMTYPILLNVTRKRNMDWRMIVLLVIQGLAMYCLATRVATYGVLLMLIAYLGVYFVCLIFKKVEWNKKMLIVYLALVALFAAIFPFSPAYVNQGINYENDWYVLENESWRKELRDGMDQREDLIPWTQEYIWYWAHVFEDYHFFLTFPSVYYLKFYSYKFDPKFWVDMIFEYDFYDRNSGRDAEIIFTKYKWAQLSDKQKFWGMTWSIPMEGGIVIEQDFVSQYYTHGLIGAFLMCSPWILLLVFVIAMALKKFKKVFSIDILIFGLAYVAGLAAAYNSGHMLCEVFGSIFLAGLLAKLLRMVTEEKVA